jgi:hypothetical protein
MWGPDVSPIPPSTALYQLSLVALGFVSFGIFCKYALVPDRPAVPREYPFSGLITELGGLEENKVSEYLNLQSPDHTFTPRNRPERKISKTRMNELTLYIVPGHVTSFQSCPFIYIRVLPMYADIDFGFGRS